MIISGVASLGSGCIGASSLSMRLSSRIGQELSVVGVLITGSCVSSRAYIRLGSAALVCGFLRFSSAFELSVINGSYFGNALSAALINISFWLSCWLSAVEWALINGRKSFGGKLPICG
jgi:hypothetical protein